MSNAQATQRSWSREEEKILNQSSIETINNAEYAGKWKQRRYQQLRRVSCVDRRQPPLRVTLLLTRAVYHISLVMSIIFRAFVDLLDFLWSAECSSGIPRRSESRNLWTNIFEREGIFNILLLTLFSDEMKCCQTWFNIREKNNFF